nr:uncharacterized protein LOC126054445 [Helicoverpa armigera]
MGSARVSNAKPIPMESTDKKSFKTIIKNLFGKKKEKPKIDKKEKIEEKPEIKTEVKQPKNTNTVAAILENLDKLHLEDKKPVKEESSDNEDDELNNFEFKIIEEPFKERIHSHSSEDSGFSDTKEAENVDKPENDDKVEKDEQPEDLAEELEKLGLDEDSKKKKKKQTVCISRGPIKNKLTNYSSVLPYPAQDQDYKINQITTTNKHTLSGGQVLVNQCQTTDNFSEVKQALETVQKNSQYLQNDRETYLEDVMELIKEETNSKSIPKVIVTPEYDYQPSNIDYTQKKSVTNTYLTDYAEKSVQHNELMQLLNENYDFSPEMPQNNGMGSFGHEEITQIMNYVQNEYSNTSNDAYVTTDYTFPTPPRSEAVPSPMSASPGSFYPTNSEYTLSPERSPIYNSDYEKYQEIPHFEEEKESTDKKSRERTASMSSMTLKQFKDMQKDIVYNFSKKDCCQVTRKSCQEIFQEHLQRVEEGVRKNMCLEMSKRDLKEVYGVLHHIILSLSTTSDKEDMQYGLFALICDRLLAQNPALFVGDAGLSLLKSAALRCPHRPVLTRYLVQCIRAAIKSDPTVLTTKEFVFHEVDALGDNLVTACARAGDRCADVLSELLRPSDAQPPLFRPNHTNADGYTALHVASSQHSAARSRLHTAHVLIVHGGLEITEGDLKGGDTALHLAVNSPNCDLQMILMMFKQFERKDWRMLAHYPNLSTKTPLDLARLATKSSTRQNYPIEVLEFLKKCR